MIRSKINYCFVLETFIQWVVYLVFTDNDACNICNVQELKAMYQVLRQLSSEYCVQNNIPGYSSIYAVRYEAVRTRSGLETQKTVSDVYSYKVP